MMSRLSVSEMSFDTATVFEQAAELERQWAVYHDPQRAFIIMFTNERYGAVEIRVFHARHRD